MKKRLTPILFALLFLGSCGQPADDLKVISFNIRYNSWYDRESPNRWESRRDAVVRMIREERPAALGLQEALIDQLLYLDSCLPQYRRVGVGRDDGMEAGEFMAIYYDTARLELTGSDTWWLSDSAEVPSYGWDAACRRTVTRAAFRDRRSGRCFDYFNTHLDHVGQTARAESARMVAALVDGHCFDKPAIVGGDMNTTIDDTIFRSLYAVGLQDARTLTDSTSHAITYNAFGQNDGAVIDHRPLHLRPLPDRNPFSPAGIVAYIPLRFYSPFTQTLIKHYSLPCPRHGSPMDALWMLYGRSKK